MQKGNDTLQIRIMNFKAMSILVNLLSLKCTDKEKFFYHCTKNFLLIMLMSVALLSMQKAFAWDVSVKPISDKLVLKTNDTRWIRLGAGYRGTGLWTENLNGNLSSGHYSNDNARLYLNGQINQYLKFEVNTECFFCNNTASGENPRMSYNILDAIAKFEYNRYFNVWGGRMLAPTERGELSGPFF